MSGATKGSKAPGDVDADVRSQGPGYAETEAGLAAVLGSVQRAQTMMRDEDVQYPLGTFVVPERISRGEREQAIGVLAELPSDLRNVVRGLDVAQLATPYRDGGWTVQELVHHLADSHTNAVVRVKLALTEDQPVIKPYDEKAWVRLHDARAPMEWALELLEILHARWVFLLQKLTEAEWARGYVHPENGPVSVERATLQYAWHSRHHLAHMQRLREREGW